jgi:hypothetical protein
MITNVQKLISCVVIFFIFLISSTAFLVAQTSETSKVGSESSVLSPTDIPSATPITTPVATATSSPELSIVSTSTPTLLPSPASAQGFTKGDINQDHVVNIQDYSVLTSNFGSGLAIADLNSDGVVNIQDYILLSNNFGKSG